MHAVRPATLLQRILSDQDMKDCYYDVSRIQRGDRPIMEAICEKITSSIIPGVYAPEPVPNGTASLLERVTRWAVSEGDEEGVAAGLERLSKYGFIEITDHGCILVPAVIKSQATSSAINGKTSPGRPRNGESKVAYCTRVMAHREALLAQPPRLSATDKLGPSFGKQVTGEDLARMLRVAPSSDRVRDVEALHTTNGRAHPEIRPSPPTSTRDVAGHKVSTDAPRSPASVVPAQAPTEGAAVCVADRRSAAETVQATLVLLHLRNIAKIAADRWNWSTRHREEAPWIFQQCLDRGYTVEQLRLEVDTSTKPCSSASFYNQFFPSLRVPAGPSPSAKAGNR